MMFGWGGHVHRLEGRSQNTEGNFEDSREI